MLSVRVCPWHCHAYCNRGIRLRSDNATIAQAVAGVTYRPVQRGGHCVGARWVLHVVDGVQSAHDEHGFSSSLQTLGERLYEWGCM